MDVVFPGLESAEFEAARTLLDTELKKLEGIFAVGKVGKWDSPTVGPDTIRLYEELTACFVKVLETSRLLGSYIHSFVSTDSRNDLALARRSEMEPGQATIRKLAKSLTAWIGSLDIEVLLAGSQVARDHEFSIRKAKIGAQHLMTSLEESLVSDMELTGGNAWTKLYGNVTSQLNVSLVLNGKEQVIPISEARALAYDADRDVRKAAYEAELKAWKTVEVPLAAAMNAIKGETINLAKHRGWGEPLDEAVYACNMDRASLEAMMTAAHESFPHFRRYLKAKAKVLGVEQLGFYDLFAPVGNDDRNWEFGEAADFVVRSFASYSDKLSNFAKRSFDENWHDAGPRPGKQDGAYCMGIRGDESRLFMNFKPAFGAVSTLAHELGHAYHNLCLYGRTPFQRATPMTLAETASIFCETIIRENVLEHGTDSEKFTVLEASLQGTCQVVVDISSRYLFEKRTIEARAKRELSTSELSDIMIGAQLDTYGDGLAPDALHPYMWAAKSHYYGRCFYNFPYMFGLLFGLGLYAVYEKDPENFKGRYDVLLSSTGLADAATLADGFGIDIRTPDFWRASLNKIKGDVDRFESLI